MSLVDIVRSRRIEVIKKRKENFESYVRSLKTTHRTKFEVCGMHEICTGVYYASSATKL